MKKTLLLLVTIFIFSNLLFSDEISKYPIEEVKTFANGTGDNELKIVKYPDGMSLPNGAICFAFDNEENVYINDYYNTRILVLDKKYNFVEKYQIEATGNYFDVIYNKKRIALSLRGISVYQINGEETIKIMGISFYGSKYETKVRILNSIILDNIVLIQLQDKTYISIPDPTPDYKENLKKVLNQEETIEYVNKKLKQKGIPKNERISMKDNMIYKGNELLTKDFEQFYQHKKEQRIKKGLPLHRESNITEIPDNFYSGGDTVYYLGMDTSGNTYWKNTNSYIAILSPSGYSLDYFKYDWTMFDADPENGMGCYFPEVHPNGDLYFLGYDFTESKLYRIKRRWFSPAVITEKEIKLKDTPSLSAKETGEPIKNKTEVEVLERNDDKTTIDKKEDYWYKVKAGALEGWIFGGYMEFVD